MPNLFKGFLLKSSPPSIHNKNDVALLRLSFLTKNTYVGYPLSQQTDRERYQLGIIYFGIIGRNTYVTRQWTHNMLSMKHQSVSLSTVIRGFILSTRIEMSNCIPWQHVLFSQMPSDASHVPATCVPVLCGITEKQPLPNGTTSQKIHVDDIGFLKIERNEWSNKNFQKSPIIPAFSNGQNGTKLNSK